LLELLGIKRIDVIEINEERREYLRKFSVANILNTQEERKDYDIAIICAANLQAIQEGFKRIRRGGTLSIFAQTPEGTKMEIFPNQIYFECTLMGTYSSSPIEQREILELLKEGKIKTSLLITHIFPLSVISGVTFTILSLRIS